MYLTCKFNASSHISVGRINSPQNCVYICVIAGYKNNLIYTAIWFQTRVALAMEPDYFITDWINVLLKQIQNKWYLISNLIGKT